MYLHARNVEKKIKIHNVFIFSKNKYNYLVQEKKIRIDYVQKLWQKEIIFYYICQL